MQSAYHRRYEIFFRKSDEKWLVWSITDEEVICECENERRAAEIVTALEFYQVETTRDYLGRTRQG